MAFVTASSFFFQPFCLPSNLSRPSVSPHLFARQVHKLNPILIRDVSTTLIPKKVRTRSVSFATQHSAFGFTVYYRPRQLIGRPMIVLKNFDRSCMSFGTLRESRKLRRAKKVQHTKVKIYEEGAARTTSTKRIAELLFESCSDCKRMAAIPQGAFAAYKVRNNLERNIMRTPVEGKEKASKENVFNMRSPLEGMELTPLKYNSKLMNSIWGLYNRYSVHNFKKNNDANEEVFGTFVAVWQSIFHIQGPAANSVTATTMTKNNS